VSRDDLSRTESCAKIRVSLGTTLYREKLKKEESVLNFVFSAVNMLMTGVGSFRAEDYTKFSHEFNEDYRCLHADIFGYKHQKKETLPDKARNLMQLYEQLFT